MKHSTLQNGVRVIATAAMCALLTGCASANANGTANSNLLTTSILKIGKADAIVITQNEHAMVIDCGEEEDGLELKEFLAKNGIDHLEALIITHYDKDHVGGADTIVEAVDIDRILVPDYDGASTEYSDFATAVEEKGLTLERLTESVSFNLGEALVTVDPPLDYSSVEEAKDDPLLEIDNNLSLITTIVHGNNRLLYMGDAEKARIKEFLTTDAAVDCDFLKVPHHGVYTTALVDLLDAVTPEYAAINDSAKNPADDETLQLLKDYDVTTRQTLGGRITVVSDGETIEIQQKTK